MPETISTTAHDEAAQLLTVASAIVREDHDRVHRTMTAEICNRADIDLSLDLDDRRKALCEAFRQRFYPQASRVVAVFGQVFALLPAPDGLNDPVLVYGEVAR